MRGVPQSGLWSEVQISASGTGSERAEVASVAVAEAPREPGFPGVGKAAAGGGRSEVKRSRACSLHDEPRTESPSEAAEPVPASTAGTQRRGIR
jgi:hypothetical protein